MRARCSHAALALALGCGAGMTSATTIDWIPQLALEVRSFPNTPSAPTQFSSEQWGLILESDTRWESTDGAQRALFEPYLRLDSRDPRRNYADVRELSFQQRWAQTDLLVGVSRGTWGVAESRNVVDVINQIDAIEDIDEGEKLGQPMVRLSRGGDWGTVEAYWLPYFRERRFPSTEGRLRSQPAAANTLATYSRDSGRSAGDVALRFKRTSDQWDVGLHAFQGTDRLPRFRPTSDGARLHPHYVGLRQIGLDVQWTSDVLILRLEAVRGESDDATFSSWVAGFEYTLFGLFGTAMDLGVVGEQLRDTRRTGNAPVTPFDDDHFLGLRMAGNDAQDTELLVGAIRDRKNGAVQGAVEFQRRLGTSHLLEVEMRVFDTQRDPLLQSVSADDTVLVRLTRFF